MLSRVMESGSVGEEHLCILDKTETIGSNPILIIEFTLRVVGRNTDYPSLFIL